jgi:hypothetical protein
MATDDHRFLPPPGFKANKQFRIARGPRASPKQARTNKAYNIAINKASALGAGMVSLKADDFGSKIQRSIAQRITHANWAFTTN